MRKIDLGEPAYEEKKVDLGNSVWHSNVYIEIPVYKYFVADSIKIPIRILVENSVKEIILEFTDSIRYIDLDS